MSLRQHFKNLAERIPQIHRRIYGRFYQRYKRYFAVYFFFFLAIWSGLCLKYHITASQKYSEYFGYTLVIYWLLYPIFKPDW